MRDLVKDIGLNQDQHYLSSLDWAKERDELIINPDDAQFEYFAHAVFTPLDLMEYEDNFAGYGELRATPNYGGWGMNIPYMEDALWPDNDTLAAIELIEERDLNARNQDHFDILEAAKLAAETDPDEQEFPFLQVGGGGDDEDEEGDEEGDEDEESEEEYGEEKEDPFFEPLPEERFETMDPEQRYFMHGEQLKNRFNEQELDAFMRLLNVRPTEQWQDDTIHHGKAGLKDYEDDAQMLDPEYHLIAEVERKHLDKQLVE